MATLAWDGRNRAVAGAGRLRRLGEYLSAAAAQPPDGGRTGDRRVDPSPRRAEARSRCRHRYRTISEVAARSGCPFRGGRGYVAANAAAPAMCDAARVR